MRYSIGSVASIKQMPIPSLLNTDDFDEARAAVISLHNMTGKHYFIVDRETEFEIFNTSRTELQ